MGLEIYFLGMLTMVAFVIGFLEIDAFMGWLGFLRDAFDREEKSVARMLDEIRDKEKPEPKPIE